DYQSFSNWQVNYFGSTTSGNALATADPDRDGAQNLLEYLTGTNPINPLDAWRIGIQRFNNVTRVLYSRIANRGFEVQWTSILSRNSSWQFLNVPENQPFFAATNGTTAVSDGLTNGPARYYRVRVYEP